MRTLQVDGQLQVTAAVTLLECSRLVEWDRGYTQFNHVRRVAFEYSWRRDVDPVFGRLLCWSTFSAGAELLLKGVCLLRGIDIRSETDVVVPPSGASPGAWAAKVRKNWKSASVKATSYGNLGNLLWRKDNKAPSRVEQLCTAAQASPDQENLLIASYHLLRTTIRNRDARAYVPNVREDDFHLVEELFVPCLNQLISWLPGGPQSVNDFKDGARSFIASL